MSLVIARSPDCRHVKVDLTNPPKLVRGVTRCVTRSPTTVPSTRRTRPVPGLAISKGAKCAKIGSSPDFYGPAGD